MTELEKWNHVFEYYNFLIEFMDYIGDEYNGRLVDEDGNTISESDAFDKLFNIDRNKLEQERRELLENFRRLHEND